MSCNTKLKITEDSTFCEVFETPDYFSKLCLFFTFEESLVLETTSKRINKWFENESNFKSLKLIFGMPNTALYFNKIWLKVNGKNQLNYLKWKNFIVNNLFSETNKIINENENKLWFKFDPNQEFYDNFILWNSPEHFNYGVFLYNNSN